MGHDWSFQAFRDGILQTIHNKYNVLEMKYEGCVSIKDRGVTVSRVRIHFHEEVMLKPSCGTAVYLSQKRN